MFFSVFPHFEEKFLHTNTMLLMRRSFQSAFLEFLSCSGGLFIGILQKNTYVHFCINLEIAGSKHLHN